MRKPYPYRASTCELTPAAWRCSLQSVALASLISSRFPREDAAADYKCDHSQNEDRELHLLHCVFSVAGYYRGGRIPGPKYFCDTGHSVLGYLGLCYQCTGRRRRCSFLLKLRAAIQR